MPATPVLPATPAPAVVPAGSPWPGRLGYLGAAFLGGVLLVAAYSKAIDPEAFAQQIVREGLALFGSPFAWAVGMVAVEVGLGVALLLNLRRRSVLVAATLLVGLFVFLTARTYWRAAYGLLTPEELASCGCFGNLIERTPAEAFWQDLLMLVPALALAWVGRPAFAGTTAGVPGRRRSRVATALAGVAALAALVGGTFAALAPGLPLDDLATRLRPGTALTEICAGAEEERICLDGIVHGLGSGSHWVVLADIRAADFPALAESLNRYTLLGRQPAIAVLADFSQDERMELFWRVAPAFELHELPPAMLRPLYRKLPRTFFVEEGRVTRTFPGLPEEIASPAGSNDSRTDTPRP